jgi:hypothetical protein
VPQLVRLSWIGRPALAQGVDSDGARGAASGKDETEHGCLKRSRFTLVDVTC